MSLRVVRLILLPAGGLFLFWAIGFCLLYFWPFAITVLGLVIGAPASVIIGVFVGGEIGIFLD